jgi:hypothetical protein
MIGVLIGIWLYIDDRRNRNSILHNAVTKENTLATIVSFHGSIASAYESKYDASTHIRGPSEPGIVIYSP